jgi:RHS repeat-associated protein
MVNASGLVTAAYKYDAWGRFLQTGPSSNHKTYTGHAYDAETGLTYFGARYYDATLGRFISQDPLPGDTTNPPSLQRYLYAYDNPMRYVDVQGYSNDDPENDRKRRSFGGVARAVMSEIPRRSDEEGTEASKQLADVGTAALLSILSPDVQAQARRTGLSRAESQLGQALQDGVPLTTIVVEAAKGIKTHVVNTVKTLADPNATDEQTAKAIVDVLEAAPALVGAAELAFKIGGLVVAAAREGVKLTERVAFTIDLLSLRRESKQVLSSGSALRRTGPLALEDAWRLAGICVDAGECIVSGGLTDRLTGTRTPISRWKTIWENVTAEKSLAHGGFDEKLGKAIGDLDFHVRKPGQPYFTDAAWAEQLNTEMTAPMFDVDRNHGIMGIDIPPEVLGTKTSGAEKEIADSLRRVIETRHPQYLSKDGFVRTDEYLKRGVYFPQSVVDRISTMTASKVTSAGNYSLIFKHGTTPVLRPLADNLLVLRRMPELKMEWFSRINGSFESGATKWGVLPFFPTAAQQGPRP